MQRTKTSKFLSLLLAVCLVVGLLPGMSVPVMAAGASGTMTIGGQTYNSLASDITSGTGWTWTADTATLTLDAGYNSGAIKFNTTGAVKLVLTNNVTIADTTLGYAIWSTGDLTIDAESYTLDVSSSGYDMGNDARHAISVGGNLTITGGTVNAEYSGTAAAGFAIWASGGVKVENSAAVTAKATATAGGFGIMGGSGGILITDNSTVTANGKGSDSNALYASDGGITINGNANVIAHNPDGLTYAIQVSGGDLTVSDNANLNATAIPFSDIIIFTGDVFISTGGTVTATGAAGYLALEAVNINITSGMVTVGDADGSNGNVQGNLTVNGESANVTINGNVTGNLTVSAGTVTVTGTVSGTTSHTGGTLNGGGTPENFTLYLRKGSTTGDWGLYQGTDGDTHYEGASTTYTVAADASDNVILTLKDGFNFTTTADTGLCIDYYESATSATITVDGSDCVIAGRDYDQDYDTCGIYSYAPLTINGSRTLTVTAGDTSSSVTSSYAIGTYFSDLTISGSVTLKATAGDSLGAGGNSYGIYAQNITIADTAQVTATAGDAVDDSYGIRAKDFTMTGGEIIAKSGTATSGDSSAMYVYGDIIGNIDIKGYSDGDSGYTVEGKFVSQYLVPAGGGDYITNAKLTVSTGDVATEAALIAALQATTTQTINITDDITLSTQSVTMGASHTLVIPDGTTLTIKDESGISINQNTLTIKGGGTVSVENTNKDGLLSNFIASSLILENVTLNLKNETEGGVSVKNITVGTDATIRLASTANNALYIDAGTTLTLNGGTITGVNGSSIYLFSDAKVKNVANLFNDRGTLVTADGEITVASEGTAASATGLTAGEYIYDGTTTYFSKAGTSTGSITTEAQLITALENATGSAIKLDADITLSSGTVTMGASHILNTNGKTLTIKGDKTITIGANTLTIKGGGIVSVENTNKDGLLGESGNSSLVLENVTLNLGNTTKCGILVRNVIVNTGAKIHLASTADDALWFNSFSTLTLYGGTITGVQGSSIYFSTSTNITNAANLFNDRGTLFTATEEITVASSTLPSAGGLSDGKYIHNGTVFRMDGIIGTLSSQDIIATQGEITESLSVNASASNGETSFTYQWYKAETSQSVAGEAITGATNATFNLPTDLAADTYYYFCIVSASGLKSISTAIATATVNPSGGKPNISAATVSGVNASYTYTGSAITPTPIVNLSGATLVADTDYTVAYSNNVNVGTATITITGKVAYSGTKTVTFEITQANQATLTVNAVTGKTYGDAAFTLSTSGGSGTGAVTYTVVSGPGTISGNLLTITGAGEIKVTATKATDTNYNATTSAQQTISIIKAALTVTAEDKTIAINDPEPSYTYTVSGLKYGDTKDVVSGVTFALDPATFNSGATTTFAIKPSGGTATNYNISYTDGLLTVTDCTHATNDGGIETTPATCTDEGVSTTTCTDTCGAVVSTAPIAALGHSFVTYTGDTATCTAAGVETADCERSGCSATDTRATAAKGHTPAANWDGGTAATCTAASTRTKSCTVCHETIETETQAALGHTWNAGVVTTQPTSTKAGVKTFTCTVCGETKTESVPATGSNGDTGTGTGSGSTTTPTTPETTETEVGDNTVTTPKGQDPVTDADGNTTLPGGGTVTTESGTTIEAPAGTTIDNEGTITIPEGKAADVTLPSGQEVTLPGGSTIDSSGTVTTGGNTKVELSDNKTLDIPQGSTITDDGKLTVGAGGASLHSGGLTLNLEEDTEIILDMDIPLGYMVLSNAGFSDVSGSAWYASSVSFVQSHGLFKGVSDTEFAPNMPMNRAMLATVLARLGNVNLDNYGESRFGDVPSGQYYTGPIEWAAELGIVNGVGDGKFDPNAEITREQLAVMLYNFAKAYDILLPSDDKDTFADEGDISAWAQEAVKALQAAGIINGKGNNLFDPKGQATRAEVATMLENFVLLIMGE